MGVAEKIREGVSFEFPRGLTAFSKALPISGELKMNPLFKSGLGMARVEINSIAAQMNKYLKESGE
jgi:hypothetical protein